MINLRSSFSQGFSMYWYKPTSLMALMAFSLSARIHKVSATQLPDEVTWNVPRFLKQPRMGTR